MLSSMYKNVESWAIRQFFVFLLKGTFDYYYPRTPTQRTTQLKFLLRVLNTLVFVIYFILDNLEYITTHIKVSYEAVQVYKYSNAFLAEAKLEAL